MKVMLIVVLLLVYVSANVVKYDENFIINHEKELNYELRKNIKLLCENPNEGNNKETLKALEELFSSKSKTSKKLRKVEFDGVSLCYNSLFAAGFYSMYKNSQKDIRTASIFLTSYLAVAGIFHFTVETTKEEALSNYMKDNRYSSKKPANYSTYQKITNPLIGKYFNFNLKKEDEDDK